jgi:putative spermidine/putrescine transport system substrate-binding protein
MIGSRITRRTLVGGLASGAALGGRASGQPALPKSPVALTVMDIAGDLALTQRIFENYVKAKPHLVSRFVFTKAPMPELPGKLKAQQAAGKMDIDIVVGGYDGLTAGVDQGLWSELLPKYGSVLPDLDAILLPGARRIQQQTQGQGICIAYSPYGTLLEYMPDRVKRVPRNAAELMAWCRENKDRFMYSRPANSGPGRALMTGLPYLLGDADPTEPVKGWAKTWEFLKAIGEHIEYYPSGTAATYKEFGEGSRDMIPTTTGWDINPRALGIVPKEARIAALEGFHWVSDAHTLTVPKGVSDERMAVILDFIAFMLTPQQQANIFDDGYFYPGPSVQAATIEMAPEQSRQVIAEFGRPEYAELIAANPQEPPLSAPATVAAFRMWDEIVGAAKH